MDYNAWNDWKKEDVLANGVKIWHKHAPTQTAILCVIVDAGSRHDGRVPGIAHFTEHMLFQGTKNLPDEQIKFVAAQNGISINAATSKEFLVVETSTILPDKIDVALDICKEAVINPLFPAEGFVREKRVVLSEIGDRDDEPLSKAVEIARAKICAHPFRVPVLGTISSINAATVEDMISFHKATFSPERTTICYAGPMDMSDFVALCGEKFGDWKKADADWDFDVSLSPKDEHVVVRNNMNQAAVILAYPGVEFQSDDSVAIKILCDIIGGGSMVSRMFRDLRNKKGLCYFCNASHQAFYDKGGMLGFCGTVSSDNVQPFVDGLKEILKDILSVEPIKEQELASTKTRFKSNMLSTTDDLSDYINWFIYLWTGRGSRSIGDDIAIVDKLTVSDVMNIATKYLSGKPEVFLVGNVSEKTVSALKLGTSLDGDSGYLSGAISSQPPANVDRPSPAGSHAGTPNSTKPPTCPGDRKAESVDDVLRPTKEEEEEDDVYAIEEEMADKEPTCIPKTTRVCDTCGNEFEHLSGVTVNKCPDCKLKDISPQKSPKRVTIYTKDGKVIGDISIDAIQLQCSDKNELK